jgi:hypothetical protein
LPGVLERTHRACATIAPVWKLMPRNLGLVEFTKSRKLGRFPSADLSCEEIFAKGL